MVTERYDNDDMIGVDHYQVLGISPAASSDDLKGAYRQLARELHPDVNSDPDAAVRFTAVAASYEILSDPTRRRLYDLSVRIPVQRPTRTTAQPSPDTDPDAGAEQVQPDPYVVDVPFSVVLTGSEIVLDDGNGSTAPLWVPSGIKHGDVLHARDHSPMFSDSIDLVVGVQGDPDFQRDGNDLRTTLTLTVAEAVLGKQVSVTLPGGEVVQVDVPEGTEIGSEIRVPGKGTAVRYASSERGDLICLVAVTLPSAQNKRVRFLLAQLDKATR